MELSADQRGPRDLGGGPAMMHCALVAALLLACLSTASAELAWAWAQMIEKPQRGT
jgi:hypothetical protein